MDSDYVCDPGHEYRGNIILIVYTQYSSYMAENAVAGFVLELKDGEIPRSHFVKHLQRVVLRVLDEVIVQGGLLIPGKKVHIHIAQIHY